MKVLLWKLQNGFEKLVEVMIVEQLISLLLVLFSRMKKQFFLLLQFIFVVNEVLEVRILLCRCLVLFGKDVMFIGLFVVRCCICGRLVVWVGCIINMVLFFFQIMMIVVFMCGIVVFFCVMVLNVQQGRFCVMYGGMVFGFGVGCFGMLYWVFWFVLGFCGFVQLWISLVMVCLKCFRFLLILVLLIIRFGVKCIMFGLVWSIMIVFFLVVLSIFLVLFFYLLVSVVLISRFMLWILLKMLYFWLIFCRWDLKCLCLVFMLFSIFGVLIMFSVVLVIVDVSGLLLQVVLWVLIDRCLVILLVVSIVLIGKLLFRFLVLERMFGIMLQCMQVNSLLIWFMLFWILLKISSVLCLLYSLCVFFRQVCCVGSMLFLFWIGFSIMVQVLLEIVVFSVFRLLQGMWVIFLNLGLKLLEYFGWLLMLMVNRVCLWKLLLVVMILYFCGLQILLVQW